MLSRRERCQDELFVAGSLRELVPDDHVLVRVDRVLDLWWLRDAVSDCYDLERGRPGIDPEDAVRLMLAGLLLGLVEDRRLMREAQVNLAIRWFVGLRLDEAVPHHSSLSRIRARWGAARFAEIFQRTVRACAEAGLVRGDLLHVDATLIRADVSWESLASDHVAAVREVNADAALAATEDDGGGEDGSGSGTAATPRRLAEAPKGKARKLSRTDADARMATSRRDHRLEPSYKQLTAVDGARGVIVDAQVVSADIHEGGTLIEQLERVEGLLGQAVKRVTADKGYASGGNYAALEARGTEAVIPPQRTRLVKVPLQRFKHDAKHDRVRCPAGRLLRRCGRRPGGRYHRARAADCAACRLRQACLAPTAKVRSVLITDDHGALLRARRRHRRGLAVDRAAQARHRGLVEGVHGEAKKQHGLRRAARRGLWNVQIQAWMTAAAINLKRLAAFLALFHACRAASRAIRRLHDRFRRQLGPIAAIPPLPAPAP